MRIELDLTEEELEKLDDQLALYDEGPEDTGWYSSVLKTLQWKVTQAINEAREEK